MQDKSKQSVWATDRQTDTGKKWVKWGGAGGSWYSLCLWPQLPAATSKAPPTSAIARDCAGYKHRLWYGFQHRRRRRRRYLCAALRNFKRREQRNATVPFVLRGCQSTKINTVLCERESERVSGGDEMRCWEQRETRGRTTRHFKDGRTPFRKPFLNVNEKGLKPRLKINTGISFSTVFL